MPTAYAQKCGGIARGIIQRREASERYQKFPTVCLQCQKIIPIEGRKIADVRTQKFCSRSCAATFNNKGRRKEHPRLCKKCHRVVLTKRRQRTCAGCKAVLLDLRTKGELFKTRKNYQSARSTIRRHGALVWEASGKELKCGCGYNKYVEIAHIKAVSEFPAEATIAQINALDNLIPLCPNCHWEFDNLPRDGETVSS